MMAAAASPPTFCSLDDCVDVFCDFRTVDTIPENGKKEGKEEGGKEGRERGRREGRKTGRQMVAADESRSQQKKQGERRRGRKEQLLWPGEMVCSAGGGFCLL